MSNSSERIMSTLAIGFAVLTVLITVVFFGWWAMREQLVFGHEHFDPVRWMAPVSNQKSACDRGNMVLDIQQRLLKPGMTRGEVTALLGRPAWDDPTQIEYELGVCVWVVHGLRVYFDANEKLTHSSIVQH